MLLLCRQQDLEGFAPERSVVAGFKPTDQALGRVCHCAQGLQHLIDCGRASRTGPDRPLASFGRVPALSWQNPILSRNRASEETPGLSTGAS